MDPDENGTLWRVVLVIERGLDDLSWPGQYTEVFGPYKAEYIAIGMITRKRTEFGAAVLSAALESTDTTWKTIEEF